MDQAAPLPGKKPKQTKDKWSSRMKVFINAISDYHEQLKEDYEGTDHSIAYLEDLLKRMALLDGDGTIREHSLKRALDEFVEYNRRVNTGKGDLYFYQFAGRDISILFVYLYFRKKRSEPQFALTDRQTKIHNYIEAIIQTAIWEGRSRGERIANIQRHNFVPYTDPLVPPDSSWLTCSKHMAAAARPSFADAVGGSSMASSSGSAAAGSVNSGSTAAGSGALTADPLADLYFPPASDFDFGGCFDDQGNIVSPSASSSSQHPVVAARLTGDGGNSYAGSLMTGKRDHSDSPPRRKGGPRLPGDP